VQDVIVYGGIATILLLIIFGVVSGIMGASNSVTAGEVHWHASIAYEACGKELDFNDEKGHTTTHGHNDNLVHVEGIVLDEEDITLASFFKNSGIDITSENLDEYKNGEPCNFSSDPGMIAFYVDEEKFTNPDEIIIADKQEIRVVFE